MDPNLIHLDWERTFEALLLIVVLAFVLERALALLFESEWFILRFDRSGVKELIAAALSVTVCFIWKFDAVSMVILAEETWWLGYIVTGGVIAGGSKASVKIFHDVFNVAGSAYQARRQLRASAAANQAEELSAQVEDAQHYDAAIKLADKVERAAGQATREAAKSESRSVHAAAERANEAAAAAWQKADTLRLQKPDGPAALTAAGARRRRRPGPGDAE